MNEIENYLLDKMNFGKVAVTYNTDTITKTKFIENKGYGKKVIIIYEKDNKIINFETSIKCDGLYEKYKGITLDYKITLELIKELVKEETK